MLKLKSWISVVCFMLILLAHQSISMALPVGHAVMEIAAELENDFVSNGISYVRDAKDIGVLISNDITIDDLQRIWINCNTSQYKTFSFGMDRVIFLH